MKRKQRHAAAPSSAEKKYSDPPRSELAEEYMLLASQKELAYICMGF
jgi:hypothetical protein